MSNGLVYFRDGNGEHFVDPHLGAMAERVGVDLATTESAEQIEALHNGCARCHSQESCDDWLRSSDDASAASADYRGFCPNTDILDRLWMRGAIQLDRDRLQSASYKTDIHPDRETRSKEPVEVENAPPPAGRLEAALSAALRGDYATALGLWRPLADQGNARAQRNLGIMYHNGQGVPQDHAAAAKWIGKAAEQGDPDAQHNLAFMYDNEQGVPRDPAAAVVWYRKAAEQCHAGAQANLAAMYDLGLGVPEDYVQAHKWYILAAAHFPASQLEARGKALAGRERLAGKMSPAQLTEAQMFARTWKAT
jgi:hypothetical protein